MLAFFLTAWSVFFPAEQCWDLWAVRMPIPPQPSLWLCICRAKSNWRYTSALPASAAIVTALEQRCEITPTGLQSKPTEETTLFPTLSIWLFCLSICFCFIYSTQKSSLLQSFKYSKFMLNKEGFDWTQLCSLKFYQYHVPLRFSESLAFVHGKSPSEFNTVIIFLRFIKWDLNSISDIFLVIFTMIQNMTPNNTVKCLTSI